MPQLSEVAKLRRKVLAEVSRLTFGDRLAGEITDILNTVVTEDGPRYRCCVHKERAVLKDRLNVALGQPIGTPLPEAARAALDGHTADTPVMNVLPEACDRCPIDKFLVTDACRNCLAHNCIASCPRKAITVVANRAFIDKAKCVECGLCKRSCAYGAIIEISRPCERACELKAVTAGSDRRAVIDYDKCVSCGACKMACPFGAIADRSAIVQVIGRLRTGSVHALLAPAFVGQFGPKVQPGQTMAALRQLGFSSVREVALGADIVAVAEAREFAAAVPAHRPYLTTSCCPAFAAMVEKHLPAALGKVSTTPSPMMAAARLIKEQDPTAAVVFIGPCIAKKEEAARSAGLVDYVLTFEEVAAMLVGADINAAELAVIPAPPAASRDGINFARAGGVSQAVGFALSAVAPGTVLTPQRSEGLAECKAALAKLEAGGPGNFLEGMACPGGCVGGPGVLEDFRLTGKLVERYADTAAAHPAIADPEAGGSRK